MTMSGEHGGGMRAIASRAARALGDVPRGIWIAVLVVIAALIAVIASGGFAPSRPSHAELGLGDEARTELYAITVIDAELTDAVESEFLEADDGETLLVLTTRMENLSSAPIGVGITADRITANLVNTANPLLAVQDLDPDVSATVWRDDGSAGRVVLQPGVPSEVTLAWTVPEDAFPDGVVSLDVHEAEVRRGAVILSSGVVNWRPAELSARITVPIGAVT